MVFGWGKKKASAPENVRVQIPLGEAAGIADDVMATKSRNIITEAANTLHATNKMIRELNSIRRDLENDKLNLDEVDKRVQPLVKRGKKMLINVLKSNTAEIKPIRTPMDISGASGELEHRLKRLGNILGKQSRVIHLFADKYSTRLKQLLEEMENNRVSITQLSNRYQAFENIAKAVSNGIESVRAMEKSVQDNTERRSEAEAEIRKLDAQAARLESAIRDYHASEEYAKLQELRRRLQQTEDAKTEIASEIALQFTSISRPLGRYEWVSADKEQTALLRRAQQNPYDVMNSDDQENVIALLQNILRAVKSGAISVKDIPKASAALERIISAVDVHTKKIMKIEADIAMTTQMVHDAEPVNLQKMKKEAAEVSESKDVALQKAAQTAMAATLSAQSIPMEVNAVQTALRQLTGTHYDIEYRGPETRS